MTQDTQTTTWKNLLSEEKKADYFQAILKFLQEQYAQGKTIYPARSDIFNAFKLTSFENIKVVILGQDPYFGPNQAHGLAFSVPTGIIPPPSLKNIYKELQTDLNLAPPNHGYLEKWAQQGVLLLNASLTVEAGKPTSHAHIGWQRFTDKVVDLINVYHENVAFLLWGSFAQRKGASIDSIKHCVLKAPHPSPLSAARGFFGCKHFSKANDYLISKGREPIDWQL